MDLNNNIEPELQVWMLEHFNAMAANSIWRPDDTGLRYRKTGDDVLTLEHRVDHPQSLEHHQRITAIMESVNLRTEIGDDIMVTPAALTPEEAFRREMQERQRIAESWTVEDGTRIADLPLENAQPEYIGDREILLDDGETTTVEDWGISVPWGDGQSVLMSPDDYNILAGDDLFMRYKNEFGYVIAMSRQQMFDFADRGELGVLVGSECPDTGDKVPPWMWGTYCTRDYNYETIYAEMTKDHTKEEE